LELWHQSSAIGTQTLMGLNAGSPVSDQIKLWLHREISVRSNITTNAGKGGRKHFAGKCCMCLQMGLVGKHIFTKHIVGTRGTIARALADNMVWVTAEHAAGESTRMRTLKISSEVDGEPGRLGRWLTKLHGLLGWGHERAG
jgi:hypothetical protein